MLSAVRRALRQPSKTTLSTTAATTTTTRTSTGPPDLPGPFDPARDHLLVIFEGGQAYLYRLDGTASQTRALLTVTPRG
jgi:hypothetical protein